MGDFYQETYASRVLSSQPDRSCLVLHPDGSITTVSSREVHEAWRQDVVGPNHPGIPGMGYLEATDAYGYNLSFFYSVSPDGCDNPSAEAFLRACLSGDAYVGPVVVQGPLYISDTNRNLQLTDWKAMKYCWRSQTAEIKAKWANAKEGVAQALSAANGTDPRQRISAVQIAKTPKKVVYLDSGQKRSLELTLSKREIMLLAHPLLESMEGTGMMDSVEYCANDPDLCLAKYTDELTAFERLCQFQSSCSIEPGSFKPNLALPICTEDMETFVWVQSDSEGSVNKVATKLLRMRVLGDAIVARRKGHGLEDLGPETIGDMLERVRESKKRCSLCGSDGTVKVCSKCNYTCYCSEECQHEDWADHKDICVDVESLWAC